MKVNNPNFERDRKVLEEKYLHTKSGDMEIFANELNIFNTKYKCNMKACYYIDDEGKYGTKLINV